MSSTGCPDRFRWHLALAGFLMLLGCWANSGTLAPYAVSLSDPWLLACGYLANSDHLVHFQPFLMLQGAPESMWQSGIVLRRLLYPILAWPGVYFWGFLYGGVVTNLLMTLASGAVWVAFILRIAGRRAAIVSAWFLATYPGIAYWAGLPYSYATIVPASLLGAICLWGIAEKHATPIRRLWWYGSGMGLLFTAYDGLAPFFVPALLWILLRQRRFVTQAWIALLATSWPLITLLAFLKWGMGANLDSNNSQIYGTIIKSWLHFYPNWEMGLAKLTELPLLMAKLFFYSNFFFLPLAFLWFFVAAKPHTPVRRHLVEEALLLTTAVYCVFLNLVPDYPGWQMRGEWIARIYQPVFVVFVLYISRYFSDLAPVPDTTRSKDRLAVLLVAATVFANGWVVLGGLHVSTISDLVWHDFYQHSQPMQYSANLRRFGTRPLGFCRDSKP
ncbi:MAG: hypothetical protein HQL74_12785 [Magnetococcales bacterium]|nr:hypothetical protein [Magnetococcales bacterium]